MVDVKAREKQLRERLAELEGRLHRIEDHLDKHPTGIGRTMRLNPRWIRSLRDWDMRAMLKYRRSTPPSRG